MSSGELAAKGHSIAAVNSVRSRHQETVAWQAKCVALLTACLAQPCDRPQSFKPPSHRRSSIHLQWHASDRALLGYGLGRGTSAKWLSNSQDGKPRTRSRRPDNRTCPARMASVSAISPIQTRANDSRSALT